MRPDDTAALPQGHAQVMKSVISVTVYGQPTNNAPMHMPGRRLTDIQSGLISELRRARDKAACSYSRGGRTLC